MTIMFTKNNGFVRILAKDVKGSTLNYTHLIEEIQVKHQEIGILTTHALNLFDTCTLGKKNCVL